MTQPLRTPQSPRKVVGYVRVSTTAQAEEGVSLEAQRERIAAWARSQGLDVAEIFEDAGMSGKRAANRPGLQAALAAACRQKAVFAVYSLSRAARSTTDALAIADRLQRAGADFASLSESLDTTSPAGRMMFTMLAAVAQFEREINAERTRMALGQLRAKGHRVSGLAPYGFTFDTDGRTQPVAEELVVVERMAGSRSAGAPTRASRRTLRPRASPPRWVRAGRR